MKVKNDHRSKFSNLSNWKEEAWKKSGLQRDSNPWPPRYRCVAHGFESLWSPDFFQASSFQLLKLENLLRWSFFTFIFNRSLKMNYLSFIAYKDVWQHVFVLKVQRRVGNENVVKKKLIAFFQSLSRLFLSTLPLTFSNVSETSWSWIPRDHIQVQKEK